MFKRFLFSDKNNSDPNPIAFIQKYKAIQIPMNLIHDTGRFASFDID